MLNMGFVAIKYAVKKTSIFTFIFLSSIFSTPLYFSTLDTLLYQKIILKNSLKRSIYNITNNIGTYT